MTKTFTENDLVRFLYGELNEEESAELKQALITSPALQEELNNLQEVTNGLKKVSYKPSRKSLDRILDFSKGYEVHSA
ncbi:MAG: hypothetical protein JXR03_14620 [Cyclobacteriaceae bacterium]